MYRFRPPLDGSNSLTAVTGKRNLEGRICPSNKMVSLLLNISERKILPEGYFLFTYSALLYWLLWLLLLLLTCVCTLKQFVHTYSNEQGPSETQKLNLAKSLTFPSLFFLTIYLNIKNKMYTLYTYIPVRAKKGLF